MSFARASCSCSFVQMCLGAALTSLVYLLFLYYFSGKLIEKQRVASVVLVVLVMVLVVLGVVLIIIEVVASHYCYHY